MAIDGTKVFLSHSSKDRQFVERVFALLGPDRAFIDQYAFDDGTDLTDAIVDKLTQSRIFCLFLSANSIPSKWVKAEARLARALHSASKDNSLPKSSPFCVFVRSRRRPYRPNPKWRFEDIEVRELSVDDMESLIGQLLNESETPFSSAKVKLAADRLGGHPLSAFRFVGYARRYGVDAALQNEAIMVQYRELLLADALDEFDLNENSWMTLFTISRFRLVNIAALSEYTTLPVSKILPSLEALTDAGLISQSGDMYSVAPFVQAPLERYRNWPVPADWQAGLDERVAHSVETFIDDGIGSSALLNNAIAATLRLGDGASRTHRNRL